jgi:hypothetical protein
MGLGPLGAIGNFFKDAVTDVAKGFVTALETAGKAGHTALKVAGTVPVLGAPANIANSIWYLAEGDLKKAGQSAFRVVPIVGLPATAVEIISLADTATDPRQAAGKIIDSVVKR